MHGSERKSDRLGSIEAPQRETSKAANSLAENDKNLVPGTVDVADSLTPPAKYGTYSIRLPFPNTMHPDKLEDVRVIVIGCMDKRVALPVYMRLVEEYGYSPDEILSVFLAGGAIQGGNDRRQRNQRRKHFSTLFKYIGLTTKPEQIIATAHTSDPFAEHPHGCGGIEHFCNGNPLSNALKPDLRESFTGNYDATLRSYGIHTPPPDFVAEFGATATLLPNITKYLPESLRSVSPQGYVVVPDETRQSVQMINVDMNPGCSGESGQLEQITR